MSLKSGNREEALGFFRDRAGESIQGTASPPVYLEIFPEKILKKTLIFKLPPVEKRTEGSSGCRRPCLSLLPLLCVSAYLEGRSREIGEEGLTRRTAASSAADAGGTDRTPGMDARGTVMVSGRKP